MNIYQQKCIKHQTQNQHGKCIIEAIHKCVQTCRYKLTLIWFYTTRIHTPRTRMIIHLERVWSYTGRHLAYAAHTPRARVFIRLERVWSYAIRHFLHTPRTRMHTPWARVFIRLRRVWSYTSRHFHTPRTRMHTPQARVFIRLESVCSYAIHHTPIIITILWDYACSKKIPSSHRQTQHIGMN